MRRLVSLSFLLAACSTSASQDSSESGPASTGATSASGTEGTGSSTGGEPTEGNSNSGSGTGTTAIPETTGGPASTSGGSTDDGTTGSGTKEDYGEPGAAPVGNVTFTLVHGDRTQLVEVWYPADAGAQADADLGHPIAEFVPPGPDQDALVGLLQNLSPQGQIGVRLQTRSARDAAPSGAAPYPLIVFSHCHNCVRFSAFTLAEHLASRGFVVAAPDHVGNTLFDQLKGDSADIDEPFLEIRVGDQQALIDALLDPEDKAVPEAIRGAIDSTRIGAMGHSYGAATTGRLAQDDDRIVAALPIAAPVESPFFPKTQVAMIAEPTLFVLAVEDNSILQLGNNLIESNFDGASKPTHLVRIKDTGHWGPTDICGLVEGFNAGCGAGKRMTDGTDFTYLDPLEVRAIVSGYAAAFFDLHLNGNQAALEYLQTAEPGDLVEVDSHL